MTFGWFGYLMIACLLVLALCIILVLIKGIVGHGVTERIVAVNMIGTMAMVIIIILSIYLEETGLLDVSLLYALLSFLAVIVLCKVYLGVYKERRIRENIEKQIEESHDTTSEISEEKGQADTQMGRTKK